MKNRTLGKGGFEVSEIGLGCWQIGADWGTQVDEREAEAILEEAVKNGIRFFDTADVYGDGRSERLIGKFLSKTDATVKVATKFGRNAAIFPDKYTEKGLREGVENSLSRLGVERLDLLQLHCIPAEELKKGDIFNWLRDLKQEGKIAYFGASVESVEEGFICLEQEGLQSLQVIYNIFRQKLTKELLPQAYEKGVGIIVRLPLASGLLTGKFDKDTTFAEDDHRNFNRDGAVFNVGETFAGLDFEKGVELTEELKELGPDGISLSELSLRWILSHKEVSTIIPGASNKKHIADNAKASGQDLLNDDLMQKLENFYWDSVHDHIRGNY